ncbi:unnamed protein product, partial [Symbiodinium sp. KB8]
VSMATNPSHYGNPKTGCQIDEEAVRVSGMSGDFCSPKCDSRDACPKDMPAGDSADPECALRTGSGEKFCALLCTSDADCGQGLCQHILGTGICTYTSRHQSSSLQ